MRAFLAIAVAAAATFPGAARAASCSFSSNGVAFGSYDPTSPAAVRAAGTITYSCSDTTWALVLFDGGRSGNVTARAMTSGPEKLAYNVYKDANATSVWGDTWGSGVLLPLGTSGSLPVYGSIPARQDAAAGAYGDTLTLTIFFL